MDEYEHIQKQLQDLETKIDTISRDVKSMRRYFAISTIISIVVIVLPLIILAVTIPFIFSAVDGLTELYSF